MAVMYLAGVSNTSHILMFSRIISLGNDLYEGVALFRAIDRSIATEKFCEPKQADATSKHVQETAARDTLIYEELMIECSKQAQQILTEQEKRKAETKRADYWKHEYELSVRDTKLKLLQMSARNDALERELTLQRYGGVPQEAGSRRHAAKNYASTY